MENVDINARFCILSKLCNDGSVENEYHFMVECMLWRKLDLCYMQHTDWFNKKRGNIMLADNDVEMARFSSTN